MYCTLEEPKVKILNEIIKESNIYNSTKDRLNPLLENVVKLERSRKHKY